MRLSQFEMIRLIYHESIKRRYTEAINSVETFRLHFTAGAACAWLGEAIPDPRNASSIWGYLFFGYLIGVACTWNNKKRAEKTYQEELLRLEQLIE